MKQILIGLVLCWSGVSAAHQSHHDHADVSRDQAGLGEIRGLMESARSRADEDEYLKAREKLDALTKPGPEAILYRAEIQQYFHEFDKALKTLEGGADSVNANILRANILYTQGQFAEAQATCKKLFGRADQLVALTCLSQAMSMRGKLDVSFDLLNRLVSSQTITNSSIEHWAYVTLAEMAERQDRSQVAAGYYQKALALRRHDVTSRIAYADILLENNQFEEARKLTEDYLQHDLALLRYVRALNIQGDKRNSGYFCELKRRVLNYSRKQHHLHYDLLAEYYLTFTDQFDEGLKWARQHWQSQKTPRDARLLARAAVLAGEIETGDAVVNWKRHHGLEDRKLDALIGQTLLSLR